MGSATQLTSAFDFHVQVIECTQCGAPVQGMAEGGQIACAYCDAQIVIERRVSPRQAPGGPPGAPQMLAPYPSDPARDDWVRSQLSAGYQSRLDVKRCYPPELVAFTAGAGVEAWKQQYLPTLRQHWQRAVPTSSRAPDDEYGQFRVYWLAVRQSMGFAFLAGDVEGQPSLDLRLKQRAVLETALGLLTTTFYGDVLRCRLSRAAALAADLGSARAWLTDCDPHPPSVDLDGEIRLAYAALYAREGDAQAILEVLGPAGREIPIATQAEQLFADAYRIHAYEVLGDQQALTQLYNQATARHGAPTLRGAFETAGIAPQTNQAAISAAQRPLRILLAVAFGLPLALGLIIAVVAVFMHFVLGYD
ncbi:MAG: hypothetical protein JRI68_09555 [Deltaproteobacteria bacterium]|nr:hypothetical protein [Deltaproteobacteria bacterium]